MRTAVIFAATTAMLGLVPEPSNAQAGDAKNGRDIYVKVGCWGCHGYDGQGGVTGPRIAPDPMPADALIAFLRGAASSRMPPYDAKGLPDPDVHHIRAYLATIPKPGDWKQNPLLKN